MKRLLILIVVTVPFLMCFQCGCDEPDTIVNIRMENATSEELYWSGSPQPWVNADCRWSRLPSSTIEYYDYDLLSSGEIFRLSIGGDYLLLVDADMRLRASWPIDSVPMAESTRCVSDTTMLESTNCNDIHPTVYTHTFTLQPEDLLQ